MTMAIGVEEPEDTRKQHASFSRAVHNTHHVAVDDILSNREGLVLSRSVWLESINEKVITTP